MSIPTLLAGDIGGTRTRLGLFDPTGTRPQPVVVREFSTLDFTDTVAIVSTFMRDDQVRGRSVQSACFGVAGPVVANAATLTNVPWRLEGDAIASALSIPHVSLLNDLQAMAHGVPVLHGRELHVLQEGTPVREGNMALVAAGTGLGEALLHNVDGRFIPSPSEAGQSDFAARTEREIALLQDLTQRFGRVSVERVVSGPGLVNLHRLTHSAPCRVLQSVEDPDAPAIISAAAIERRCPGCHGALEMFIEAYGAEAGNLALRTVSTGGLFVGGGIARRILPALVDGRFLRAFADKSPFESMLRSMPVKVILNDLVGLLGAAVYAARAMGRRPAL